MKPIMDLNGLPLSPIEKRSAQLLANLGKEAKQCLAQNLRLLYIRTIAAILEYSELGAKHKAA